MTLEMGSLIGLIGPILPGSEFGLQSNFKSSKQQLGEIRAHVFGLQKQVSWVGPRSRP